MLRAVRDWHKHFDVLKSIYTKLNSDVDRAAREKLEAKAATYKNALDLKDTSQLSYTIDCSCVVLINRRTPKEAEGQPYGDG